MEKTKKQYYSRIIDNGIWTRLIGPGLDYHDLENIGDNNLEVVLKALDLAFYAGRQDKAIEICKALNIKI